jgi:hypothetical protein
MTSMPLGFTVARRGLPYASLNGGVGIEVLRLGGYEREYFITQTPELAAMADVVIDLDSMHVDGHGRSNANTTEDAA